MEDILASIRRILSEDEAASLPSPPSRQPPDDTEVFSLDPSMLVAEPPRAEKVRHPLREGIDGVRALLKPGELRRFTFNYALVSATGLVVALAACTSVSAPSWSFPPPGTQVAGVPGSATPSATPSAAPRK